MRKLNKNKPLGISALALMSVAGVFSLRNLPLLATYGYSLVFYYALAAIIFFIPIAFVVAELASGWPKTGGMYVWVREAFGAKFGLVSIWFEWMNTLVWFPAILTYIAATIAYVIFPDLANDKLFALIAMLGIFWSITLINFFGIRLSSWFTSVGLIAGTLLPAALIIGFAIAWLVSGKPVQIHFHMRALIPTHFAYNAFFTGLVLSFTGIHIAAFHAQETKNPQRDYPRAILIATLVIVLTAVLGALAIAIVIPQQNISFVAGLMQTTEVFFSAFHATGLVPVIALLIAFGAISMLNTWVIGPPKGLLAASQYGDLGHDLSKVFRYKNKRGVPYVILLVQGFVGSVLAMLFLFLPTINLSYWMLTMLTAQLTMITYVLIFFAAIRLRYTQPHVARPYKVPGGNIGMWIVGGVGALTSGATMVLGFIPPHEITAISKAVYEAVLWGGLILFTIPVLLLVRSAKTSGLINP